jgi:nicotinamidase-related amidase
MTHTPRRALLVIDVQNEYVTGNLPIAYPPVAGSLANIAQAIDAANAHGVPVVLIQQDAPATSPLFAEGSDGWQLHPDVAGRQHAHLIRKQLPSAFTGTDLAAWLSKHEIDTLTVVGYMTQNCNASTIFEALHAGLHVEYLHDASGAVAYANAAGSASAEEIHRVFCTVFHARFAAVADTAAWIAAVGAGQPLAAGNIVASHTQGLAASAQ